MVKNSGGNNCTQVDHPDLCVFDQPINCSSCGSRKKGRGYFQRIEIPNNLLRRVALNYNIFLASLAFDVHIV